MARHRPDRTRAVLLLPLLLAALLLVGCGGGDDTAASGPTASGASASVGPSAGSSTPASCPTENTRSFAKTRFVADLGGAAFLTKRYIYTPYREGKFRKGASGRTAAVVKAGLAAATSVKLLKNAQENAQANPTLCKTIATPLAGAIASLGGVTAAVASGDTSSLLGGLSSALDTLRGLAGQAGINVPEEQTGLTGG